MGFISETTIIEFNGLPGIGKSTITNCLEELCIQKGVSFYRSYYRKPINRRAFSLLFRPSLFRFLPSILLYAKKQKGGTRKYKYVIGTLAIVRQYVDFKKYVKNGILVLDQGIIQDFISIAHASRIVNVGLTSTIMKKFKKHHIQFTRIDCDLSVEEVFNRLRNRSNGGSRIEKENDANAMKFLEIQKRNLMSLRHELDSIPYYSHISIDASELPHENACKIWNTIYDKKE